jgi:hypothetical protein
VSLPSVKFGQSTRSNFQSSIGCSLEGKLRYRVASAREGSRKRVKEEFMKSLSELADVYEQWATANEATAEEILSRLDSLPGEAQQQQRWRASQVMAEAAVLKKRAAELRKLEQRRAMYCVDPTTASGKART